jgi:hypothetical protein
MNKETTEVNQAKNEILKIINKYSFDEMREIIGSVGKMIDELEQKEEEKGNGYADYSFGL